MPLSELDNITNYGELDLTVTREKVLFSYCLTNARHRFSTWNITVLNIPEDTKWGGGIHFESQYWLFYFYIEPVPENVRL